MKKVLVLGFVFCLLGACSLHGNLLSRLAMLDENACVCFYCGQLQQVENAIVQKNGDGAIITCAALDAASVYKNVSNCFGFSVRYQNKNVLDDVLSQIRVLKTEMQDDITIYYGLAQGGVFFDFVGGQKINIQIAVSNEFVVVGSPIILGGY